MGEEADYLSENDDYYSTRDSEEGKCVSCKYARKSRRRRYCKLTNDTVELDSGCGDWEYDEDDDEE